MTELNFNTANVAQDTNWYCGPASIQNAISIHGIYKSEAEIARRTEALEGNHGWDDRDGTDHISQITTVLNEYLPNAGYVTRLTTRDPMTAEQKALFQSDVITSIDSGYAVVINIVSPPGNRPRGQLGSSSPNYGYGTVFHYMTIVGYRWVNGVLYLKIADSGFRPFVYWLTFDQTATLTTPKGYSAVVEPKDLDTDAIIAFLKAYLGPLASDIDDIHTQITHRWTEGKNLRDAVGELVGR